MKFWTGFFTGMLVTVLLLFGFSMYMNNQLEDMLADPPAPVLQKPGVPVKADFNLKLHELRTDSLLDTAVFRNKVVLLNFWEFWCVPCREEMPGLKLLYNTVKDSSVVFAFISTDRMDSVRNSPVVRQHDLPYYHSNTVLPVSLLGELVPRTYIINKKGGILVSEAGKRKWDHPSVVHFIDSLKKL